MKSSTHSVVKKLKLFKTVLDFGVIQIALQGYHLKLLVCSRQDTAQ